MKNKEFSLERFLPLIRILTILFILLIAFKVIVFLMPFVIAFIVVSITKPIVNFLVKKLKWNFNFANTFVIMLFYALISIILGLAIIVIVSELFSLLKFLIDNKDLILNGISTSINEFNDILNIVPEEIYYFIQNNISRLMQIFLNSTIGFLSSFVYIFKNIPIMIIYTVITIISTFLISADSESVHNFFEKQFPKSWIENYKAIKTNVFSVVYKYFKSQLILIVMCFLELLIGFSIISLFVQKIDYILILALSIAIIDALPIIGTGGILIPASIYLFAIGNVKLGLAILIMYLVIAGLRYTLEPKILSDNLNVNPLLSLVSMYVGFKFFGVLGFLFGPILLTIMTYIFREEIEKGFFKILSGEDK